MEMADLQFVSFLARQGTCCTKTYIIYQKKMSFKDASTSQNDCLKMDIVKDQYARKVL